MFGVWVAQWGDSRFGDRQDFGGRSERWKGAQNDLSIFNISSRSAESG